MFRWFILPVFTLFSSTVCALVINVSYGEPVVEDNVYKQSMTMSSIYDVGPEYGIPQAACSLKSCYVALAITDEFGITGPRAGSRLIYGPLKFGEGVREPTVRDILISASLSALPLSGIAAQDLTGWYGKKCISLVAQNFNNSSTVGVALDPSLISCSDGSGGGIIPPPPDPNFSCSMQEKIELNHGSINLEDVRGHRVSENLNIQCTGKGSVRLSFNLSKINLEPKGLLTSSLYLNGSSGGLNLVVDKSANVSIESQLNIIDGASVNGEFIGNAVLIMTVL